MLTEDGKEIDRTFQVTEKVAIVAGGGKGIGKTICAAFARVGALVMVVDVDRGGMGGVVQELQSSSVSAVGIAAFS